MAIRPDCPRFPGYSKPIIGKHGNYLIRHTAVYRVFIMATRCAIDCARNPRTILMGDFVPPPLFPRQSD